VIPLFKVAMHMPYAADLVAEVLGSGYVGEGRMVERFEARLANLLNLPDHPDGEPPILAVNSCTMALTIALDCIGVGPGDEVITTPITCTATSGAIVKTGATLVWADVDPVTGCIDPMSVLHRIVECNDRTLGKLPKAVIAVDWGGRFCDYSGLAMLAGGFGIPIIQDAAHSFLGKPRDRQPQPDDVRPEIWKGGGDYVCYSFGPIKHLTTGGYGGGLITPPDQTKRARLLRWHGLDRRSSADFRCAQDIVEAGYRGHMTDDQAAVGLANAERVEWVVARHRENAAWYLNALRGVAGITLPPPDPGSSWWLFTVIAEHDRDGMIEFLAERGIMSSPVHAINTKHSAFRRQSRGVEDVPNAEYFDQHQLSVPVGWWLSEQDRERVASAIWEWSKARCAVMV
jgi:dTDP-4-amino-4,6-dideoxygalactose transaminase